jgi:RNA polymerase sigma-70 factor, ECF subfamily
MAIGANENRQREFEAAALPYLTPLFNFALKMTRSRERAEDLVQDTYLRAYRAYATFTPGTNMKAWLFQILKNVHINVYRSAKCRPEDVAFDAIEGVAEAHIDEGWSSDFAPETPETIVMNGVLDGEIQEALEALPEEFREVVLLAFVEEMSYREIADVLGIPMGTVMSRLHRGRKLLQARLTEFATRRGFAPRRPALAVEAWA